MEQIAENKEYQPFHNESCNSCPVKRQKYVDKFFFCLCLILEYVFFVCEKCGSPMVIRSGAYGNFYACSNYPQCKNTLPIKNEIGVKCPRCGGEILARRSKSKTVFYSCENYPKCPFSSWDIPTNEKCPVCSGMLMKKKGKNLLVCSTEGCLFKKDSSNEENS